MTNNFTFIDLFAGIGGIRLAFEAAGGDCVFSAEYDRFAQKTYKAYFGERPDFSEIQETDPPGDVTQLDPSLVPDHDILTAGFPCQPFSLAGVSKKKSLGKPHGFSDPTQGTLFFNLKEIIKAKRPAAFLLENVKHLKRHDNGRTFATIQRTLDELGYDVDAEVIDAAGWVPQHRERIYIAGFRRPLGDQTWRIESLPELHELTPPPEGITLNEVIDADVPEKYTLGTGTWNTLIRHRAHHEAIGNGFGYGMISEPYEGQVTRTLSARYHKDGAEILIEQTSSRPRRLTPLECSRLMGFPDNYQELFSPESGAHSPVSDTQAYRQLGNSIAVPLVSDIAILIADKLHSVGALVS